MNFMESLEFFEIPTKSHRKGGDNHCKFHPLSSTTKYYDMRGPFSLTYNIYPPASAHEGVSGLLLFGLENDGSEGMVWFSYRHDQGLGLMINKASHEWDTEWLWRIAQVLLLSK